MKKLQRDSYAAVAKKIPDVPVISQPQVQFPRFVNEGVTSVIVTVYNPDRCL